MKIVNTDEYGWYVFKPVETFTVVGGGTSMSECIFCKIVARDAPATIVYETDRTMTIVPLNPVVDGHVITLPKWHAQDASASGLAVSSSFLDASEYASGIAKLENYNLITNNGKDAGQSVFHLHVHTVPRVKGDGLKLPWSGQIGLNGEIV